MSRETIAYFNMKKEYTHYFSMFYNSKIGQLISFKAFKKIKIEI